MQIIRGIDQPITPHPTVLTIGKFDGVHRGHQVLIQTAVAAARYHGFASAVLTFDPHPRSVLRPDQELQLLTSIDERAALIRQFGADYLVVAPFTRETMATPAEEYMRTLCQMCHVRELVVGEGFVLGRNREGTVPRLMEIGQVLGYGVVAVAPVQHGHAVISASRVRELVRAGEMPEVTALLGRPFGLMGPVVEGDRRGHAIGFPTANLAVDDTHILPLYGVYAGMVRIGGIDGPAHPAVANVGVRPTFAGTTRRVEAHLLEFSGDLYGQTLWLEFAHFLRTERKFSGIDELRARIALDAEQARTLMS